MPKFSSNMAVISPFFSQKCNFLSELVVNIVGCCTHSISTSYFGTCICVVEMNRISPLVEITVRGSIAVANVSKGKAVLMICDSKGENNLF